MNWENLKLMACPKCTGKLEQTAHGYKCSHDIGYTPCTFSISFARFEELMRDLYNRKKRNTFRTINEDENLSRLNNL